jgi:hypothetical protein
MTTEEIALRILCAQIESGRDIGNCSVREAFAMAVSFEEQAKQVRTGRQQRPLSLKLAHDDNGL